MKIFLLCEAQILQKKVMSGKPCAVPYCRMLSYGNLMISSQSYCPAVVEVL